jgi:hypothetical protein
LRPSIPLEDEFGVVMPVILFVLKTTLVSSSLPTVKNIARKLADFSADGSNRRFEE